MGKLYYNFPPAVRVVDTLACVRADRSAFILLGLIDRWRGALAGSTFPAWRHSVARGAVGTAARFAKLRSSSVYVDCTLL